MLYAYMHCVTYLYILLCYGTVDVMLYYMCTSAVVYIVLYYVYMCTVLYIQLHSAVLCMPSAPVQSSMWHVLVVPHSSMTSLSRISLCSDVGRVPVHT